DDYEAAERFALRLEASGNRDQALLLRGTALLREERFVQALDQLNQVRDQGELRVRAAALSGQCLLNLGETHQAERSFLFVLGQQSAHIDAHRGLAAVYFDQGALERAVLHCQEWAKLAPRDGRPYRFLGVILKDLDRRKEAIAAYQAALERTLSENALQEV